MDVDCILFDWGGTLASVDGQTTAMERGALAVVRILLGRDDPAAAMDLAARAIGAEHEAAKHPELREVDLAALLTTWAEQQGGNAKRAQVLEAVETLGEHWIGSALHPLPGALETIQTLKAQGYRIGLVSNVWIPPSHCRRELATEGFLPFLDFTILSGELGYRKPSPHIYEAALTHAGQGQRPADLKRILFVGDSPAYDCIAPAALGMRTALVESTPGFWPAKDLALARPDAHIRSVSELPALLAR